MNKIYEFDHLWKKEFHFQVFLFNTGGCNKCSKVGSESLLYLGVVFACGIEMVKYQNWGLFLPMISSPRASSSFSRAASPRALLKVCRETAFRSKTIWLTFNRLLEGKLWNKVKDKFLEGFRF